jgi:hypothetical protein
MVGNEGKSATRALMGIRFIELAGSRNIVPTPTAVVRTTLQKRVGGYCLTIPHAGDMEMWLRLAANASVGILDAVQAVYRHHASNMSHMFLTKDRMPDLEQRKAAIGQFGRYSASAPENGPEVHRRLLSLLARDAIGAASKALNDGNMAACSTFSAFALEICPSIEKSMPWIKLSCKRWLGVDCWRALQPIVALWRQHTLSMKR